MDKETILKEIRRLAAKNGGVPPGRLAAQTEAGITESSWRGVYWVRWSEAVKEAGFEPNERKIAYSNDHLLESLAKLAKQLGRIPTEAELKIKTRQEPGFPSGRPFARLGGKSERIGLLREYCLAHPEFEGIATLCDSALAANPEPNESTSDFPDADGFVYLIKSGRHYKIGRTNDLDRRESALAYQTVHKNVKIHSIRTDDPSGIEAYWHRRFADKRVRSDGEWFTLSAKDVSAFRRRKGFM